jgi:Fe-S-cluster-containing dehydrogenase component
MSENERKYWQGLEAREGDASDTRDARAVQRGLDCSRPDIVGVMGLSAAAAGLAACTRAPVAKVVPYLAKPDEVTPGKSVWYASSCPGCDAQCGVLDKARDGRPIKVEGNPDHPVSQGGLCAVGQAAVLATYDSSRARGPMASGRATSWAALDASVQSLLARVSGEKLPIRVVVPVCTGPTFDEALSRFSAAWPGSRIVRFEPSGERTALAQAAKATHGLHVVPDFRFDRAEVVASFAADFLGAWISPVAFARQYAQARALPLVPRAREAGAEGGSDAGAGAGAGRGPESAARTLRHWQLEPALSLTGSNADERRQLAPSELLPALAGLVRRLASRSMHAEKDAVAKALPALPEPPGLGPTLDRLAADLLTAGRAGLVVCGLPELTAQALCLVANEIIGSIGHTVDVAGGAPLDETALSFEELLVEAEAGRGGLAIFAGVNPVYAHPQPERVTLALARMSARVSLGDRLDETGKLCGFLAPDHAPAESWGDILSRRTILTLRQPALSPIFQTRPAVDTLLLWAKTPPAEASHHALLRERFRTEVVPKLRTPAPFEAAWRKALHDGFVETVPEPVAPVFRTAGLPALLAVEQAPASDTQLWLYEKVALRDGRNGNNAWLHELPDPVSKVVWDNYACLSPKRAAALGLSDGSLVTVSAGGRSVTLPVLVSPGTHEKVVAIALGYGRSAAGSIGDAVGVRAMPLAETLSNRQVRLHRAAALVAAVGRRQLAKSQTHASLEGRPHVRSATLAEWRRDPGANNPHEEKLETLWSGHEYKGHRWGMAIDLSACTGCAACVVACQAENNVATVGKSEVGRGREMFWLRIDRYYEGEPESPREVLHQPMLCQHCTNAPCETVCPVLATNHSSEGLNQQAYNRCVGTRYCENNCPPKVRRFNWFENRHDDPVERLVLNPDVVVRSRGVMEKCSFCIQRILEGKAEAKRDGRPLRDGEIQTACQQSCPSRAITFGDLNDPASRVSALARDSRGYRLLYELNIGPAVTYLTRVRNPGGAS